VHGNGQEEQEEEGGDKHYSLIHIPDEVGCALMILAAAVVILSLGNPSWLSGIFGKSDATKKLERRVDAMEKDMADIKKSLEMD